MKLLVGTLYTIENEFDECRRSIQRQTYTNYDHIVIKDLPKKEAHDTLYGTFMDKSDTYDLLIKVDADMILCKDDLFGKIVDKFSHDHEMDLLLIAVRDFYTDDLLIGMNIFRNTVRWRRNENDLMTDMVHIPETVRKTVKDFDDLAPAADHCPDPGPFQSFHFGFHRGMKAFVGGTNWRVLYAIFSHYRRTQDSRLAYAMLGANAAFTNRFAIEHISYNDDTLLNFFNREYDGKDSGYLHRAVKRSKLYMLFSLPIDRRILYRYYRLKSKIFQ
jgi:hypothetical protein